MKTQHTTQRKNNDHRDPFMEAHNSYFFSLMAPTPVKKKRKCLRCGIMMVSKNAGHRICGSCNETNSRQSALGVY